MFLERYFVWKKERNGRRREKQRKEKERKMASDGDEKLAEQVRIFFAGNRRY